MTSHAKTNPHREPNSPTNSLQVSSATAFTATTAILVLCFACSRTVSLSGLSALPPNVIVRVNGENGFRGAPTLYTQAWSLNTLPAKRLVLPASAPHVVRKTRPATAPPFLPSPLAAQPPVLRYAWRLPIRFSCRIHSQPHTASSPYSPTLPLRPDVAARCTLRVRAWSEGELEVNMPPFNAADARTRSEEYATEHLQGELWWGARAELPCAPDTWDAREGSSWLRGRGRVIPVLGLAQCARGCHCRVRAPSASSPPVSNQRAQRGYPGRGNGRAPTRSCPAPTFWLAREDLKGLKPEHSEVGTACLLTRQILKQTVSPNRCAVELNCKEARQSNPENRDNGKMKARFEDLNALNQSFEDLTGLHEAS
ncbi:hypothetical protein C8F04DRAFT_1199320 [Mycena alexandri]|uniref:Uncharacterized protein n=1 Tax=Mycena alexandri TaxID=1745969 RepID=A0AAD6RZ15_9AGAR|nr:hypothetical protein C8F04DRAFT_1199320 [Mycena alexandri]